MVVLVHNAAAGRGLYIPLLPRRRKLHIPRFAASGKAHSFRCSSFPHKISDFAGSPVGQSDFASQKSCVCAVTPRHKIRLSYCREKAFVATLCRTAEYAATPFPRQPEAKV